MAAYATRNDDTRLTPIIGRLSRPIGVSIVGRDGVGRATVAEALARAGIQVGDDIRVLVVAEAFKPEDHDFCAADRPMLIVVNKADLLGAASQVRADRIRQLTGLPTVPMSALPATAVLDDALIGALRVLAADPHDPGSTDAFCAGRHRVDAATRARLLAVLDRSGVAEVTQALRRGAEPTSLPALLRELSGLDRVLAGLDAVAAEVRYLRIRSAIIDLRTVAARSADERLSDFLTCDDVIAAVMAAAAAVVRAAGLTVDTGGTTGIDAHLHRAVQWRRYGRGPVNVLHRSCGADIVRGSLRLAAGAAR